MSKRLPRTALITGAASGIGAEYARECASMGMELVLVDINGDGLSSVASEIREKHPIHVHTLTVDLSQGDAPKKCISFCDDNHIDIELLINNAGLFVFDPFLETDPARQDTLLNVHIMCMTHMCRLFGERMKSKRFGYIINMSSMSVWMAMPGINIYNASKAYIRGLSRSLYFELKPFNVSVTAICPAGVNTSLLPLPDNIRKLACRLGFLMSPDKLVKKALRAAFRKKIQSIPGAMNDLFAFFMMILPNWLIEFVTHRLPGYQRFWDEGDNPPAA